ncbi:FtsX-like permease family protein [Lentzea sp. NPDC059081]|uniref:FtsX-like permease family protein n=1 Tax=Lentzea sp. NPDC059081 TaxID=3346719 RepID=UPI0036AF476B
MTVAVLRTQLSGIARRPGRLVLTGSSVLVACFLVFGAVLARDVALRAVADSLSTTPAATDVVVTSGGADRFTAEQLARVRATPGVAEAVGRVESAVRLRGVNRTSLTVVADPGTGPLSRVRLVAGTYPAGPGQVAVDERTAGRFAVGTGSRIALTDGDLLVTGIVAGPADPGERAYTVDSAAASLGGDTGYSRIDVRAAGDAAALASGLGEVVDPGRTTAMSVRSGASMRAAEVRDASGQVDRVFELIAMFVAVSVLAAALVATATFRIVFTQRTRQLALLRTVGAQPGQLVRALIVEGAVVGLVAGVAGVALAQVASYGAVAVARSSGVEMRCPDFLWAAGIAVVVGSVLLTVGAVTAPAFTASRAAPLQVFRTAQAGECGLGAYRLVTGLVLGVAAVGLVSVLLTASPAGESEDALVRLVLAVMATFGALVALGPALVCPVLRVVSWPVRRFSTVGSLAAGGVGGAPRRAAGVSVVVALGVALIVATFVGTSGMTAYLDDKLATRAPADVLVSAEPGVSASAVSVLRASPALRDVTTFRTASVKLGDLDALALDLHAPPPGQVHLARWAGSSVGDRVTLRSATGEVTLTVTAVLPNDGPFSSAALLAPADLDRLGASGVSVLANAATPGEQGLITARDAVRGLVEGAEIGMLSDLREQARGQVAGLLAVALGLLGLTVLIAVVGVGTTTALSVHERTGEIGLLRALGLGRGGVRTMIATESGLYGALGAVLGLVLGVPFAWLAVSALDIGVPLTLPLPQLLLVAVVLVVVTGLAGFLPARKAARVSPVAALGTAD